MSGAPSPQSEVARPPGHHSGAQNGEQGRQSTSDRHILLGISHPSNDPALHRTFAILATFDRKRGGWIASVGEKNANDQLAGWSAWPVGGTTLPAFATASECLGNTVASIVTMVDGEQDAAHDLIQDHPW